ncbi:unnamed protein product [Spirodela intermedia]|uniref:Small RNA 2'-O-methyltransferase n=1 Tax=Spirodela intermedia TaxID=51605 RepID=A0A7I8K8L5_SPIIN|nr:unnamed protein product [Spirodela intermedia]
MSQFGVKKPPLSAKAVLHQRYGDKACYKVEQVLEPVENDCPGLAILHHDRVLYRCHLQLPELSVTSEKFTKRKDAEQSAAKMALEKLGIQPTTKDLTPEEAWDELIVRISSLFTDKFSLSGHPIVGHFRAAIKREGDTHGLIPVSIIAACDSKIVNLCKLVNPKAGSDPLLVVSLVLKAARLVNSICVSDRGLWMGKKGSYSSDALQSLISHSTTSTDHGSIEALFIPSSIEKPVETITLELSAGRCYMDEISQKLGVEDSSHVLVSRAVGKASSEMRFYFSSPRCQLSCPDLSSSETPLHGEEPLNLLGSYFSGQNIYGDAVLATVGYAWKSKDLFCENVTLSTYYRMLLGMTPDGCYKLSREAILAVKLPSSFTTKSNWRGHSPRDLLCMFCRHHRLMEPLFSVKELPAPSGASQGLDQLKSSEGLGVFACEVKILSKQQDPILECLGDGCKKQTDAVQKAALSALSWLDRCFKRLCVPLEEPSSSSSSSGSAQQIRVYPERFSQELAHCFAVHARRPRERDSPRMQPTQPGLVSFRVEGLESGAPPAVGSLVSISYTISLVGGAEEGSRQTLESRDELEFELGTGAVIDHVEACVSQMSTGQSAQFTISLPSRELVLAASGQSAELISPLDLRACSLEYSLKVLQISEPNEVRMEQALFSPPLSKQRVDFAMGLINSTSATSLVDFGCGSGSLLDSLMEHQTTLEKVVGVDVSTRGLCRAAKILHAKLAKEDSPVGSSIKSAVLYGGSITDYDSRLHGFDVGTCLEVIEHMEEDQAGLFGEVVLSLFCPRLLIISTPNYEYNPVLQGSLMAAEEDDRGEKSRTAPCRFRNHDHKFEWTRGQFERWAVDLASRHSYRVDFGGVGGSPGVEPGFASQIAVFRRCASHPAEAGPTAGAVKLYEVIWEWPS